MKHQSSLGAPLLCLAACLFSLLSGPASAQQLESIDQEPGGDWQLTWKSQAGAEYRVERSFDLENWEPVDSLSATGDTASLVDDGLAGQEKVFWRVVLIDDDGTVTTLRLTDVSPDPANPGHWQITWESEAGVDYRLERSFDLQIWQPVGTIAGLADFTSMFDTEVAGQPEVYWRVVADDGGPTDPLVVGDLLVDYRLDGADSSATVQVVAGGTELVTGVRFFDGPTELGTATRGFGDSWYLQIPFDPDNPQVFHLEVEVTTEEGTVERSDTLRILLADPSKYVPLDASGTPLYGQLVEANSDGTLGAFTYYPEGIPDPARTTGVRFEFETGATIGDPGSGTEISFTQASFYPGTNAESVTVNGGASSLNVDALSPDEIGSAFGLPTPIQLEFGSSSIAWESGPLGDGGWNSLQIDLPIGDFGFPNGRLNATIGVDPEQNVIYLIVCYFGEWSPLDSGISFRIPEADPLKIYLSDRGEFAAHGTAEASFPSGAEVRGTLSWRDPIFEFSFEAKGIVIPALDSLVSVLPADTTTCIPVGESPADLDEFAKCLDGYRQSFRALAGGASAQADVDDSESTTPLATPSSNSGSGLEAWAGRLASWEGDRAGETLTEAQVIELGMLGTKAAETACAALELPTPLKIYRDLRILEDSLPNALDASPASDDLTAKLTAALAESLAAIERIAADDDGTFSFDTFNETAALMLEIPPGDPPPAPASRKGVEPPPARGAASGNPLPYNSVLERAGRIFGELGIIRGDDTGTIEHGPNGNPFLAPLSTGQLLARLAAFKKFYELYQKENGPTALDEIPTEDALKWPIKEAFGQVKFTIVRNNNLRLQVALEAGGYAQLKQFLDERARILEAFDECGIPIDISVFNPNNPTAALAFETALLAWLPSVESGDLLDVEQDAASILTRINGFTNDEVLDNLLDKRWTSADNAIRRFIAARLNLRCFAFLDDLDREKVVLPSVAPDFETDHRFSLTGNYESRSASPPYRTLQLNQAGRYLTGFLQENGNNFRLRGHYTEGFEDDPDLNFAVLKIVDGGVRDGVLEGVAFLSASLLDAESGEVRISLGDADSNQSTIFRQTSRLPAFSPETSSFFTGALQELVVAHQVRPIHTTILNQLKPTDTRRNSVPSADDPLFKRARTLITSYKINENNASAKLEFARQLNDLLGEMLNLVEPDAYPALELLFLQELSKPPFLAVGDLLLATRTHRDRFFIMVRDHPDIFMDETAESAEDDRPKGKARTLLGEDFSQSFDAAIELLNLPSVVVPDGYELLSNGRLLQLPGGFDRTDRYHYRMKVVTGGLSGTAKKIGIGAFDLKVTIEKYVPGNESYNQALAANRNPDSSWTYEGWLAQAGLSRSIDLGIPKELSIPGGPSVTISVEEHVTDSPFNYDEFDFEGPIVLGKASGTAQVGIGITLAESFMTFFCRSPEVPSLYFDTGDIENPGLAAPGPVNLEIPIKVGAGVEISVGRITKQDAGDNSEDLAISETLLNLSPEIQADFDALIDFKFGSFTLNDCGRQHLREMVAEHRALLASPATRIAVLGFADGVGEPTDNLQLSLDRANAVKTALLEILGPNLPENPGPGVPPGSPRLADESIVVIGLGEVPAQLGYPSTFPPGPGDDPNHWLVTSGLHEDWQEIVWEFGQLGAQTGDAPNAAWRRVVVVINGVVSIQMGAPQKTTTASNN